MPAVFGLSIQIRCSYRVVRYVVIGRKMAPSAFKLSLVLVIATAVVSVNAASIGDALVTIYADPIAPIAESDAELIRDKRDPEALGLRGLHHHHHHHGGGGGGGEEYYSKPSSCYKCGGGGGGAVATFAQSSAGTISTDGGHGGHGGGGQSVSQSAAYNFGPFSASFSSSQSSGNGGLYGGFF